jgi:hypothetical protein
MARCLREFCELEISYMITRVIHTGLACLLFLISCTGKGSTGNSFESMELATLYDSSEYQVSGVIKRTGIAVVFEDGTPVFEKPGGQNQLLISLDAGNRVSVLSRSDIKTDIGAFSDFWYEIEWNEQSGYVFGGMLSDRYSTHDLNRDGSPETVIIHTARKQFFLPERLSGDMVQDSIENTLKKNDLDLFRSVYKDHAEEYKLDTARSNRELAEVFMLLQDLDIQSNTEQKVGLSIFSHRIRIISGNRPVDSRISTDTGAQLMHIFNYGDRGFDPACPVLGFQYQEVHTGFNSVYEDYYGFLGDQFIDMFTVRHAYLSGPVIIEEQVQFPDSSGESNTAYIYRNEYTNNSLVNTLLDKWTWNGRSFKKRSR